jgi:fucose 4-O-acetylase-like acetyltransferase
MILVPVDRIAGKSASWLIFEMRGGHMEESSKRLVWVDVAKALAMVLVVVGHPVGPAAYTKYIYWFHMPVFFLLSGYLFKPPDGWSSLRSWLSKRSREILIPYCAYLVLVTIVWYCYGCRYLDTSSVLKILWGVLIGGRAPGVYYTVFWFFTCLFATQVLFAIINLLCKDNRLVIAVVAVAYLLAHVESWLMASHPPLVPWDLDVALMAVVYYAIGYFCKKLLANISLLITSAAVILSVLLIVVDCRGLMNYVLNLKYLVYQHLFLDLSIPMVMAVALLGISQILARSGLGRVVSLMGNVALPVVYLHVPVNTVLLVEYHCHYGNFAAILFGLAAPIILSKLVFERFPLTRYLFQGRLPPNQKSETSGQRSELALS